MSRDRHAPPPRAARPALWMLSGALVATLMSAPMAAGPPAAIDPSPAGRPGWVERSFKGFAADWLRVAAREGGRENRIGKGWEFEVRPTRSQQAPWVGILRYSEEHWSCRKGKKCRLEDRDIVSEIFRFQDGRWVY